MTFKVIDNKTGKEPDLEDIVLNEEWAYTSNLIYCDMEGFAITNNGDLIMLDECGNYEFCPEGRFTVSQESVLDKIRTEIEGIIQEETVIDQCGGEYEHIISKLDTDDVLQILDKYKAESEEGAKE